MSTIQVANPDVTPQLSDVTQPVAVIHGSDTIGSGTVVTTASRLDVTGHYQWPVDAPAEVQFQFSFEILSSNTCNVTVNWPGLLPGEVGPTKASYIMLLLMARPQFLITTPDGVHINATYVGPFGHPEIVTALQVGVGGPAGDYSQMLSFRYEH